MVTFTKGQTVYTASDLYDHIEVRKAIILDDYVDSKGCVYVEEDRKRDIHITHLFNTPQEAFNYALEKKQW